jgi:hypothetical protein
MELLKSYMDMLRYLLENNGSKQQIDYYKLQVMLCKEKICIQNLSYIKNPVYNEEDFLLFQTEKAG